MPYLVVAVDSSVPWTQSDVPVTFAGVTLTLRPGSRTLYPTVVLEYASDTDAARSDAVGVTRRFLSALAWAQHGYVREEFSGGGGSPIQLGRAEGGEPTVLGKWRADYLPEPTDVGGRRALAFYREARGLEHVSVPYAFLGYTKILNIKFDRGRDQIAWINSALAHVKDHRALEQLTKLRSSVADIGDYLYGSGRCAVAHAYSYTVDPDDVAETRRLSEDLPLARALAEYFIESELGVKSTATVYAEHLYELEGFKKILGQDIVSRLKNAESPAIATLPTFPPLRIRLNHGGREADEIAFDSLSVARIGIAAGVVVLYCVSADRRLHLAVGLDFVKERLVFQPDRAIEILDDADPAVIDHAIVRLRFFRAMILNGRTEIYNAESGERLGRTDAFVGMNIDLGATVENLDKMLGDARAERERRASGPP